MSDRKSALETFNTTTYTALVIRRLGSLELLARTLRERLQADEWWVPAEHGVSVALHVDDELSDITARLHDVAKLVLAPEDSSALKGAVKKLVDGPRG